MRSPRVLNERAADPELALAELSQAILDEARAIGAPGDCAELDSLTGQLRRVDPRQIEGDAARIAFWANLYNALILHRLCLKPVKGNLLRHLGLFGRTAYDVGGLPYTLNLIEHGLLRRNRRPPYNPRRPMRASDSRLAAAPEQRDPRIHFALNCGARSCPPIRHYEPDQLDAQLELATRAYLESETEVDPEQGRVTLPRLMRLYRGDFGDRDQQLEFAAARLPAVREFLDGGSQHTRVGYGRFDWRVAQRT